MTEVIAFGLSSPIMVMDWEESGPGASLSTEKFAQIFKRKSTHSLPPTPHPPHTQLLIPRFPQVLLGRELVWGPQGIFSPDCLESLTPGTYISADRLLSSVVLCRLDVELRVA